MKRLPKKAAMALTLGFEVTASIVLPILLGMWSDTEWNTAPFGVLFGAVFGMGTALWRLVQLSKTVNAKDEPSD